MSYRAVKSSPLGLFLCFALFIIFVIYSLRKRNNYDYFTSIFDTIFIGIFKRAKLFQDIKILNEFSKYNFLISDFTAINLSGEFFPIIFGDVSYKNSIYSTNQKTIYIFSKNSEQTDILNGYPKIFKFACEVQDYNVYWVLRLNKLKKIVLHEIKQKNSVC